MVEDCTQLILNGLEINRRVGLSIFVAIVDQLILPADDRWRYTYPAVPTEQMRQKLDDLRKQN